MWEFQEKIKKIINNTKRLKNHSRKRILFLTSIPSFNSVNVVDQSLAVNLYLNGHDIGFVWCGAERKLCHKFKFKNYEKSNVKNKIKNTCIKCQNFINPNIETLSFASHFKVSKINFFEKIKSKIKKKKFSKFIKRIVYSTLVRMSAKSNPENVFLENLNQYYFEVDQYYKNLKKLIKDFKPDLCIAHHGIYFPQELAVKICKDENIKLLTYWHAYKKNNFLFVAGDSYHKVMPQEKKIGKKSINKIEKLKLSKYIINKENSKNEWINFHGNSKKNILCKDEYDLLITNVSWDAKIHFEKTIFKDQEDWVYQTIDFYMKSKKKLIIRCHPAEIKGYIPSRELIENLIISKYGKKINTSNITIISSSNNLSTIELVKKADKILLFGSKVGIDAAALGKTVIVAGDAWVKGKGFTLDPDTKKQYFQMITFKKTSVTSKTINMAQRYAYNFYFERNIKLDFIKQKSKIEYDLENIKFKLSLKNDIFEKLSKINNDLY